VSSAFTSEPADQHTYEGTIDKLRKKVGAAEAKQVLDFIVAQMRAGDSYAAAEVKAKKQFPQFPWDELPRSAPMPTAEQKARNEARRAALAKRRASLRRKAGEGEPEAGEEAAEEAETSSVADSAAAVADAAVDAGAQDTPELRQTITEEVAKVIEDTALVLETQLSEVVEEVKQELGTEGTTEASQIQDLLKTARKDSKILAQAVARLLPFVRKASQLKVKKAFATLKQNHTVGMKRVRCQNLAETLVRKGQLAQVDVPAKVQELMTMSDDGLAGAERMASQITGGLTGMPPLIPSGMDTGGTEVTLW